MPDGFSTISEFEFSLLPQNDHHLTELCLQAQDRSDFPDQLGMRLSLGGMVRAVGLGASRHHLGVRRRKCADAEGQSAVGKHAVAGCA